MCARLLVLCLLLTVCGRSAVAAALSTGNEFLTMCDTEEPIGRVFCAGYVSGIAGMLSDQRLICVPSNVTAGQMKQVALRYLQDNPKIVHHPPASLIAFALIGAFACKN
jgi:Rap1a immunity proteins